MLRTNWKHLLCECALYKSRSRRAPHPRFHYDRGKRIACCDTFCLASVSVLGILLSCALGDK